MMPFGFEVEGPGGGNQGGKSSGGDQGNQGADAGRQQQQQQQQQNQGGDQGGTGDGGGEGDEDENALIDSLLGGDEELDDTGTGNQGGNQGDNDTTELQKTLQTEILNTVNQMTVPEDVIPENFDPTDSKQLRDVLNTLQKRSVLQALQLSFKPMQLSIQKLGEAVQAHIKSEITALKGQMETKSALSEMVPEVDDPKMRGFIQQMDQTLKGKGKKPLERARLIRKAVDQLGLKSTNTGNGNGNGNGNGTGQRSGNQNRRGRQQQQTPDGAIFSQGEEALNLFAPFPTN